MPKCPRCETETTEIVKEWDYSIFHVKHYDCKKCREYFRLYFKQGKLSHTIPSHLRVMKLRIKEYLKAHGSAREDEIAKALNLRITDVSGILAELEKEGAIEKLK